jgi:hypothetical protein
MMPIKWEKRFEESDAKWERRFEESDTKWWQRFEDLDVKCDLKYHDAEGKVEECMSKLEHAAASFDEWQSASKVLSMMSSSPFASSTSTWSGSVSARLPPSPTVSSSYRSRRPRGCLPG